MVELFRHRQTKEPATDKLCLNHRATSRLYKSDVEFEGRLNAIRPDRFRCARAAAGGCGTRSVPAT